MNQAPLAGIRVIELSHMIMGPTCGMYLAMMGAEVIKIEPPGGDKTRRLGGMGAAFFPVFNRGKRSVVLDLESTQGQDALHALLAGADVLVENFRDGFLHRLGLDHAQLRERHPRLIIAAHKGFLNGPYQDRPALDEVVQMMTGLAYMTGPSGRPLRMGSSGNDIMGGLHGAFAVLASLLDRGRTGHGRLIRVGLFENCLTLVAQHIAQTQLTGERPKPMPERDFAWPVYDIFQTRDAHRIFVACVTDGHWASLCRILALDEFAADPGLGDTMARIRARDRLIPVIAERIGARDYDELSAALVAADLPCSAINEPADMLDDPHVRRPGGLQHSRNFDGREFDVPALPFEFDDGPIEVKLDVPVLGADTAAILAETGRHTPR